MLRSPLPSVSVGIAVRQALKRSDAVVGAVHDVRRLVGAFVHNNTIGRDGRIIRHYLNSTNVPKLQIGAGPTALEGWLSTDINPRSDQAVYLDATRRFPFDDGSFDYVYSEHMIEHITWSQGRLMLGECRRVLRPGGSIRVATPDLKVLLDLYTRPEEPRAAAYIKWITDTFLEDVDVYEPAFVINNAFENWGHQFLYDAETMTMALRQAGFEDIRRCESEQSDDPHLRGIESHGKNVGDKDMAAFETMVFEARRPR